MSFRRPLVLIAILAIIAFVLGCSGGGPVTPNTAEMDIAPSIGLTNANGILEGIGVMGSYELNLDIENATAELVTKRSSAIGEGYIVSGLGFFTQAPCANCLNITGIDVDTSGMYPVVTVTYSISHPFPPGDVAQPPTASNRLDLDIFDLALVVVPTGTADIYALTGADAFATICQNASAFTTELTNVTGIDAACPYFLVVDDTVGGTSTFNEFPMGTLASEFEVEFLMGGAFDLYLTMGYGASAKKAQRLNPSYFNPEFNRKAPWKVEVVPPQGDLVPEMGNTWDDSNNVDLYDVIVNVYDWQQGATVTADQATFADGPATDVYAASDVTGVSLEIPGMYDTLMTMTTADSGTGMVGDPLIYTFAVANTNDLDAGIYYGLIEVTDGRAPSADYLTEARDFIIDSPDGILLDNYLLPAYVTYQVFPATVVVGCGPITGSIDQTCPILGVFNGANLGFSAVAASANGGDPIVLYEWDMDYDGTTFDIDATGQAVTLGPFDNANCGTPPEDPVTYTVAVRATDSCTNPNVTVIDTCDVTVDNCDAPPIHSLDFEPMETGDEYFDVGVQEAGYIYVSADHVATSNTSGDCATGLRTALRFDNDLANMTVMNQATGMSNPNPTARTWIGQWEQLDVTPNGSIVTNQCRAGMGTWSVSGATATSAACCWAWACGNSSEIGDVSDHNSTAYGQGLIGFGKTSNLCSTEDFWCLGFNETNLPTYNGYNYVASPIFTYASWMDNCAGMDAVDGTNNVIIFYSGPTEAHLDVTGDCYSMSANLAVVSTFGSVGTLDSEFTGGLDIAMDSNSNIVTLEDMGAGVYRFQKFALAGTVITWTYTTQWADDGEPLRMDFDKDDDELYVITDTGLHRCAVQ